MVVVSVVRRGLVVLWACRVVGLLWVCCGFVVDLLCVCCVFVVGLLWICCGFVDLLPEYQATVKKTHTTLLRAFLKDIAAGVDAFWRRIHGTTFAQTPKKH